MTAHEEVLLYTDGAARGNPGPAAIGFLITDALGHALAEGAEPIGTATNNRAEYCALVRGLAECTRFTRARVRCTSDSELLVRQMRGEYRVKNAGLRSLHAEAREWERKFARVTYAHRLRGEPHITHVDRLVNRALDESGPPEKPAR